MPKKGRTLKQQLIYNYGQQLGLKKLEEYKNKRKYQLSQQYYIDKFGLQLGKQKYQQFRQKTKFKINPKQCARTLEFFIKKYGQYVGTQKYQSYCHKQAISNSFEYKNKKFNWTKQQFDNYNKSRAITKDNLIKKYGQQLGLEKYNTYVKKQSYTKSLKYYIDQFGQQTGKKKFQELTNSKIITKDNLIKKYGQQLGSIKWKEICKTKFIHHSKVADQFFNYISSFNDNNHKLYFKENEKYFLPYFIDFFNETTNKAIEFFGLYWHASPKLYNENDLINNKTAKEIWQRDKDRINFLIKTYNIQIKIIWQDEIKNQQIIKNLIKWIYQK